MPVQDTIRQCLQRCEGVYAELRNALEEAPGNLAKQRLQSALTNMEACINDCRSALDHA